jgi:hypothetical protein
VDFPAIAYPDDFFSLKYPLAIELKIISEDTFEPQKWLDPQ